MKNTNRVTAGVCTLSLAVGALVLSPLLPSAIADSSDAATCETTVTSGDAKWSIKESYLSYLHSPITMGKVTVTDGVTIDDPKKGPFVFEVDPEKSMITSETAGTFALKGSINIVGHKAADGRWELNQDLEDVKLVVDGNKGQIMVDFESEPYPNPDGSKPKKTGDDAVIANVTWDEAPSLVPGNVDLSGSKVFLTEVGATDLFSGFYQEGQEVSPVSLNAVIDEECTEPPVSETSTVVNPPKSSTVNPPKSSTVNPPKSSTVNPPKSSTVNPPKSEVVTPPKDDEPKEDNTSSVSPVAKVIGSLIGGGLAMRALMIVLGLGSVFAAIAGAIHFYNTSMHR